MLVEMDKGMIASLVRGMDPAYEIMDNPLIKTKGYYCGGHSDRWIWNYGFEDNCTEEDLWATYQLLKNPKTRLKTWEIIEPIPGTKEYVSKALWACEGVTYVEIQDHFDTTASVYVTGGNDEEIAHALCMTLPAWCGLQGDHLVSTTQNGFEYIYRINRRQRNA